MKVFAIRVDNKKVRIESIKGCTYVIVPADMFSVTCGRRKGPKPGFKHGHMGRPKGSKNKPAFKGTQQIRISKYMDKFNRFAARDIIASLNLPKAGQTYETISRVAVAKGFTRSKTGRDIFYSR